MTWKKPSKLARAALLGLAFAPVAYLAWLSLWREGRPTLEAYSQALDASAWPLLARTARLAAEATAIALGLGGLAGVVLERREVRCRPALRAACLMPLLLPPVFQVAAWERIGLAMGAPFRCEPVAALVLGLSYAPIAFYFASEAVRGIPLELVDAARVCMRPWSVRLRVILPLLLPHLAVAGALVMTLSLLNYEVPRLLDVTTYAVLVSVNYGALEDPGLAFAAALPLLLLAALVLAGAGAWAGRRGFALSGRESPESLAPEGRPGAAGWLGLGSFFALSLVLPLAVLATLAWPPRAYVTAWLTDWEKVVAGAAVAAASGAFCAAWAFGVLVPPRGRPASALAWIPAAVPGALVGFALVRLGQSGPLSWIYGRSPILVVAMAARFFPVAYAVLGAHVRSVPADQWEAADLVRGAWARWVRVRLGLASRGVVVGAVAVALLSLGELPATLLLAPPGAEPVIVRIYNLLHYDPERSALAALCMYQVAAGLCVVSALLLVRRSVLGGRRG
jgi:iron(III) transport system permease protein